MIGRRIGGEFVLVPLAERGADLDSILNLTRVAAFIWEQLDGKRTGEAIVDALVERYEVERKQAAADYVELLDTLRALGAVFPDPRARR
jgi:Coenzyme PQQ synthesis protein D (PqqD)